MQSKPMKAQSATSDKAQSAAIDAERRRRPRSAVIWAAKLHYAGHVLDCVILNLSGTGAKVRTKDRVEVDTPIILQGERFGMLRGQVAWAKDDTLGIKLDESPKVVSGKLADVLPL